MEINGKVIVPYKGDEPYIFISYSHRNPKEAHEIIERLHSANYRIWYDEGIEGGDEWSQIIAEHIYNCSAFIAFMSDEYLGSLNCREEWNFARKCNKTRFNIFLSDVKLPLGMEMQISSLQNIYKYNYTENNFYNKLFIIEDLKKCVAQAAPPPEKPRREEPVNVNVKTEEVELTVISPVSVKVYLQNKLVAEINENAETEAKAVINVPKEFELTLMYNGLNKKKSFKVDSKKSIVYHASWDLSKDEIQLVFNRKKILQQLKAEPTVSLLEQLSFIGEKEDIKFAKELIDSLMAKGRTDLSTADEAVLLSCAQTISKLSVTYSDYTSVDFFEKLCNQYKDHVYINSIEFASAKLNLSFAGK